MEVSCSLDLSRLLPPSGCSGPLGTLQWICREILASGLGLDEETVVSESGTADGWLKLEFSDGTKVGLSPAALAKTEEPVARSIAVSMMPPNKLGEVARRLGCGGQRGGQRTGLYPKRVSREWMKS